jgi:cytoskeletal protein CcmA (bactofilin family)
MTKLIFVPASNHVDNHAFAKLSSLHEAAQKSRGDFMTASKRVRWWVGCGLLLTSALAQAGDYNFDGSAVPGCTLQNLQYTCADTRSARSAQTKEPPGQDNITVASRYSVNGNLSAASVILAKDSLLTGSLTVASTLAMTEGASIGGNVDAGGTVTMDANTSIGGNVKAAGSVTAAAGGHIAGDVSASTVTLAADAAIDGAVHGTAVTMAARAAVAGAVEGTSVTLAEKASIRGNVAGTTVTLAKSAYLCGDVKASSEVTLAADSYVSGNVEGTAVTMGANAYVRGTATVYSGAPVTLAAGAHVGANKVTARDSTACQNNNLALPWGVVPG